MTNSLAVLLQVREIARQSALETAGPAANEIGRLWNTMLLLGALATLLTFAALAYALFRNRRNDPDLPEADRPADECGELENQEEGSRGLSDTGRPATERKGARVMVFAGIVAPVLILTFVLVATLRALAFVTPPSTDTNAPPAMGSVAIDIAGKQYWWRVRYLSARPFEVFETANELHIPVGVPVQLRLRSEDVIHSFWVPGLAGKMDLVPGRVNIMTLQADHAGVWRGQCAEFCGMQHTKMAFTVVAESSADFARWQNGQRLAAAAPDSTDTLAVMGRDIFMRTGCAPCHTIRGSIASGRLGPDLTHVASRMTLAAAAFPNTAERMQQWIFDPQQHKPGSAMPSVDLSEAQAHAVARYLAGLR